MSGSDDIIETAKKTYPGGMTPESELAHEIGPDKDADLHGDPDDPEPSPPITEAGVANWRVASCLLKLREQVNALAPNRNKASDGTIGDRSHQSRASDHNPWVLDSGTGVVTAMDITHHPVGGCDADLIAKAIRDAADKRVKYIIWNRRIANSSPVGGAPAWGWRPYTGRNGHTHHIHISVKPDKTNYDSTAAWTLPTSLNSGQV
ncbi:hypothetical protein [Neorhizobium huautlense]|uniref:hypothetical protein n=1 Tax=Neorhizobium huautlense TaxID=67774 RepID=UPI00197C81A0|nr:hypothetical protein [Neorhizobium huautlense]